MTKRTILRSIPDFRRDIRTWPKVDPFALPEYKRASFLRNRNAVVALMALASYSEISKETGLSEAKVRRLLKKCLLPDGNGDICGEYGLVPYIHARPYVRRTRVIRKVSAGRGGCSGALNQLFDEFPELEKRLEGEILKQIPAGAKVPEAKISTRDLHRIFLLLCEEVGRKASAQWPFNTKTQGLTSLANYVVRVALKKPAAFIRARFGHDAATRLHVGTGSTSLLVPQLLYDIFGIDEFTFDSISTVAVQAPGGGVRDIAIERIHIVIVVEFTSKAICGWYAFFKNSATSLDIRHAIQNALTPWVQREFSIQGLSYGHPEAGLPSGLIPSLAYHPPAVLVVDNALAHQDIQLLSDLGNIMGSFVNLGPVGAWYRRASLERKILDVLKASAQRLPSTTGSNPTDPRKNDPVETAVKLRIRWRDVLQLTEVVIAQQNATPSESIGMRSPIGLLRQLIDEPENGYLLRTLPLANQFSNCMTVVHQEVRVRGSRSSGRRPYINLDRATYTSPTLARSWHLLGKKLRIEIDEDEYRSVKASVMDNGAIIGALFVQGAWAKTPHTRQMRREINRLRSCRSLAIPPNVDPIAVYMQYLTTKACAESKANTKSKRISKSGTKLAENEHRTGVSASSATLSPQSIDASASPEQQSSFSPARLRALLWTNKLNREV
jgi:putative transposase